MQSKMEVVLRCENYVQADALSVVDFIMLYVVWLSFHCWCHAPVVIQSSRVLHTPEASDKLWVDKGKRFYNKHVQALVELYSTDNEETSRVIERWNRAMKLKKRCENMFSEISTEQYIDLLDDISRLHYRP